MARTAKWFTIGLATVVLAAMTGCSKPATTSSSSSQTSDQPAAESAESPDAADGTTAEGKNDFRTVDNVTIAPGADPLAMVFATRTANPEAAGSEQLRVAYPEANKAIVTVTKTGLKDDSVAATRTRYEFKPADGSTESTKQWQLVQVTEQNKCQKGRGSQDWVGELCQ